MNYFNTQKKISTSLSIFYLVILFSPLFLYGQDNLPISKNFANAVQNQTRTTKGVPGEKYWQNKISYNITAEVIPAEKKLVGSEKIRFQNKSPDTLHQIVLHLFQNVYQKGSKRDDSVHPDDVHSGVEIEKILIEGNQISKKYIEGTLLIVDLERPVYLSEEIYIDVKWNFTIPTKTDMRMGGKDSTSFFLGQWYPKVAVYDDLKGWDKNIHSGGQEFYYDSGDYEYSVKVPEGFMVWGSGVLQNAESVLSKKTYKKFLQAQKSETIIQIVSLEDLKTGGKLTAESIWKFKAENVSDVAFGISDHFLWDGTSEKIAGKNIFIDAAYPPESEDFTEVAQLSKKTIQYLSTELPDVPYPFPAVTVFNGTNGRSGMEYPMIANDPSADNRGRTVDVTAHEIAHNYFPFFVLTNETEHAWMDEAFVAMIPYKYQHQTEPTSNRITRYARDMSKHGDSEINIASNINANLVKDNVSFFNFYGKPALSLFYLEDMLGEKVFKECMIKYIDNWKGKHPAPEDFFNLVNQTANQNLNWYWYHWFYTNGYPDLSIESVKKKNNTYEITVEKIGALPVPINITVTFKDASTKNIRHTAAVWQDTNEKIITVDDDRIIKNIILGNEYIPDTNSANNIYESG